MGGLPLCTQLHVVRFERTNTYLYVDLLRLIEVVGERRGNYV